MGKVEQSRETSSAHLCVVAIEKGASRSPSTTVVNFFFLFLFNNNNHLFAQTYIVSSK